MCSADDGGVEGRPKKLPCRQKKDLELAPGAATIDQPGGVLVAREAAQTDDRRLNISFS